jgi:hypothetical protein
MVLGSDFFPLLTIAVYALQHLPPSVNPKGIAWWFYALP